MIECRKYKNTNYIIYADGRCFSNRSNKFLTPQMSVKYPTYTLIIDGKKKKLKIHRLVAETFLENLDNKPIVNHKDGDTHNYNLSNLEWVTYKENIAHARATGLLSPVVQEAILYKNNIIPDEKWAPVPNYPNYKASNKGRILNVHTQRLLRTPLDNLGYPHVNLWKQGRGKTHQVHKVVFNSFFPQIVTEGKVVNHIDGDKTNNQLENLECVTYQENNLHAEYIVKTHRSSKAVVMMDKEYNIEQIFPSIAEASRKTGIQNISRAIQKKYFTGGHYWKFEEN